VQRERTRRSFDIYDGKILYIWIWDFCYLGVGVGLEPDTQAFIDRIRDIQTDLRVSEKLATGSIRDEISRPLYAP
jgi:hypothetical protein